MKTKVANTINELGLLSENDRVVVAVSGGADSICLLHLLKMLENPLQISVCACHVNHNLRGTESDSDEQFVRDFCDKTRIPLKVCSVNIAAARKKHEGVEECARRLRYDALCGYAEKLNAKIATAHNACDNVETVLLNMLRGTGLKGLCGVPAMRENIIRPLINCTRAEIEQYCAENQLTFVTDKTNLSTEYTRNKLRIEIIPLLLQINPSLFGTVSRMTGILTEDSAFLEQLAADAKQNARNGKGYCCIKLRELQKPLLHRVISLILRENDVSPSSLTINMIAELMNNKSGKLNVCKNTFVIIKNSILTVQIIPQNYR